MDLMEGVQERIWDGSEAFDLRQKDMTALN